MNRPLPLASLRAVSRSPSSETTIEYTIGDTDVNMTIGFDYVRGAPPIMNDIYGGDPGYPTEIDVRELRWTDDKGNEANIEHGQLFEFIANQSCVIDACIQDAEANR